MVDGECVIALTNTGTGDEPANWIAHAAAISAAAAALAHKNRESKVDGET